MRRTQFVELVNRLEAMAAKAPGAYRRRVLLLAMLGYGYIVAILAILIGLLVRLVWLWMTEGPRDMTVKLGLALALFIYAIGRALWIRLPPPEGIALRRDQAPELFATVEALRERLAAPRVHAILIDQRVNAAVVQIPRIGFLGFARNYLVLGLPLLQLLTFEQFQAVLAHEFGHLCGEHGQFGAWIYRIRATWDKLMDTFEGRRHWAAIVFRRFFRWYTPFFSAYSFVLARQHEYEADRRSAKLFGATQLASALIQLRVIDDYMERTFWPSVYRHANDSAQPPADVFRGLASGFRSHVKLAAPHLAALHAVKSKTGADDTHPSLADRLTGLGLSVEPKALLALREQAEGPAASTLLGACADEWAAVFSTRWQQGIADSWKERHRIVQDSLMRLKALEAKAAAGPLGIDEAWQRTQLTADLHGDDEAVPLAQAILARDPEYAPANYLVGRTLLEQNDEGGIPYLKKAMAVDAEAVLPACETIYTYLRQEGRERDAVAYWERAMEHQRLLSSARLERETIGPGDSFEPHGWPLADVEELRRRLLRRPKVKLAFLVRKRVKFLPEQRCYVLGIVPKIAWCEYESPATTQQLANTLAADLASFQGLMLLVIPASNRKLITTLRKVPQSAICG